MRASNTADNLKGIDRDEAVAMGRIYFSISPRTDSTTLRVNPLPTTLDATGKNVFNTQEQV